MIFWYMILYSDIRQSDTFAKFVEDMNQNLIYCPLRKQAVKKGFNYTQMIL